MFRTMTSAAALSISIKKLSFAGALATLLCLAGSSAELAGQSRQGGNNQLRIAKLCMGYQVQPTPGGFRVAGILNAGAFPDGSTLDVGDVITQVGNRSAPFGGATMDTLVFQARNAGAPFMIVRSITDGNFYNIPLP